MSYEINADKYAFAQTPQPEKVNENYNAVLIKKLMQEEASKREAVKNTLEQNLANEVYARTDGDAELRAQIDSEAVKREKSVSEIDAKLGNEAEQRAAANASFLEALDELEADLSGETAQRQVAVSLLEKADENLNNVKEDKVAVITIDSLNGAFGWSGPDNHNTDIRITAPSLDLLYVEWWDGEYPQDYTAALSFNSGDVPTTVKYPMGGIINWIGTDCVIYDGISLFQPSANTHYEIVMYYNGTQCVGLVNGFVPSTQEVDNN